MITPWSMPGANQLGCEQAWREELEEPWGLNWAQSSSWKHWCCPTASLEHLPVTCQALLWPELSGTHFLSQLPALTGSLLLPKKAFIFPSYLLSTVFQALLNRANQPSCFQWDPPPAPHPMPGLGAPWAPPWSLQCHVLWFSVDFSISPSGCTFLDNRKDLFFAFVCSAM